MIRRVILESGCKKSSRNKSNTDNWQECLQNKAAPKSKCFAYQFFNSPWSHFVYRCSRVE